MRGGLLRLLRLVGFRVGRFWRAIPGNRPTRIVTTRPEGLHHSNRVSRIVLITIAAAAVGKKYEGACPRKVDNDGAGTAVASTDVARE